MIRRAAGAVTLGLLAAAGPARAQYRFLAAAESADEVVLAEFTPCTGPEGSAGCGVRALRTYPVGVWPADIEGPHGVVAAADGRTFYVSLAHGMPFGSLQQIDLETGEPLGQVELGMFPATVDRGLGGLIYVINFNFEDPAMAPSSLSVVDGVSMVEVARPMTCRMPHGSRLSPDGARHYSGCMMNDLLVEVDARSFVPTRAFRLTPGAEGPARLGETEGEHAGHRGPEVANACSPTWAQPSADGAVIYLACNRSAEIVEVRTADWSLGRRWKTPPAPYNLAVTPDGLLMVITQKGPGTTTVWRLADRTMLAEIPGTRGIASGVTVSADSRFAFVTLEGKGGEPGTVDVIDLRRLAKVASLDIGSQAGGIAMLPGS